MYNFPLTFERNKLKHEPKANHTVYTQSLHKPSTIKNTISKCFSYYNIISFNVPKILTFKYVLNIYNIFHSQIKTTLKVEFAIYFITGLFEEMCAKPPVGSIIKVWCPCCGVMRRGGVRGDG